MTGPSGVLIVNKPQGFTSFDVVAVMRGCLHTKKAGHGGTLDPMATGVLPVFVGNAAKAVSLLPDSGKSYRAGFLLGVTSDTLDVWGRLSGQRAVNVSRRELERVLERFRGNITQIPPMYSALKVGGRKLCDLARKGVEVERAPRPIRIDRLELKSFDGCRGEFETDCSAGTYIRSLVDDIGAALGTGAVMTSLVRTRSCGFTLEQSCGVEELRAMPYERLLGLLLPTESVFTSLERVTLDSEQRRLYLNGVRLDADRLSGRPPEGELCAVFSDGEFLGVARLGGENELISVKRFGAPS